MSLPAERLQAVLLQTCALLTELRRLAAEAPAALQPLWAEHLTRLEELAQFLGSGGQDPIPTRLGPPASRRQWELFGQLLRDKRNAAGLSRTQLAHRAKLSEATVKFTENARQPPSRTTLIRLVAVSELKLGWADIPGQPVPPLTEASDPLPRAESTGLAAQLNCLLTPSSDTLPLLADLARFLNGAGGYVEQTHAYLDHYSAADYLAFCHHSLTAATLRSNMPLGEMAQQVAATSGRAPLQVLALGAGDGHQESLLAAHLMEVNAPSVELCLLDISQPLLSCAYQHAVDRLATLPHVKVWAIQGNFHDMPLYIESHRSLNRRRSRRLITMLGGTLANLDHEPRFLRQSLLTCEADDLLLLDVPLASASCEEPLQIKARDRLFASGVPAPYATWLSGPIWRHCKDVERVDFDWHLETRCPVPGSYSLHAVATVQSSQRADRSFSLFRLRRYDPTQLAACLSALGWREVAAIPYAGEHSLRLYRKRLSGALEAGR